MEEPKGGTHVRVALIFGLLSPTVGAAASAAATAHPLVREEEGVCAPVCAILELSQISE